MIEKMKISELEHYDSFRLSWKICLERQARAVRSFWKIYLSCSNHNGSIDFILFKCFHDKLLESTLIKSLIMIDICCINCRL
jgi:hypothetical protein